MHWWSLARIIFLCVMIYKWIQNPGSDLDISSKYIIITIYNLTEAMDNCVSCLMVNVSLNQI